MARSETAAFETFATTARTGIIASELLYKFLIAVDNSQAPFDVCLRRETASSFAHGLKSKDLRRIGFGIAWFFSANARMFDRFQVIETREGVRGSLIFVRKTTLNSQGQKISGP